MSFGVAVFALMAVWSLMTPLFSGPDEPSNFVRSAAVVRGEWVGDNVLPAPLKSYWTTTVNIDPQFGAANNIPWCFAPFSDRPGCGSRLEDTQVTDIPAWTNMGRYPIASFFISGIGTVFGAQDLSVRAARLMMSLACALLIAVSLQSVIGAFTVYSATRQRMINQGFDQYFYVQRQVTFLIVAAVATAIIMAVGHDWIRERAVFWYIASSLLLILVLVYGAVTRGARLAFDLGPISVQPAELMKVVVLILIAAYTADAAYEKIDYHQFSVSLFILGFPVLLILLQPDLGSATVLVAGVAGVLLMAGAKRRYIAMITGLTIVSAAAVTVAGVVDRYQLRRIDAFLNQDSNEKDLQQIVLHTFRYIILCGQFQL